MTVLQMYDIVNLVERYQMPYLMKEMKTQMEIVAITDESLLDTAHSFLTYPPPSLTHVQGFCRKQREHLQKD